MPTTAGILAQLTRQARDAGGVALFWHFAVLASVALLWSMRWKVPQAAATISVMPLVTAAAVSFIYGGWFDAAVLGAFALVALVLAALAPTAPAPVHHVTVLTAAAGAAAVVYAFVYPHFVELNGWRDVFFTPMGVVPCPSLALTLGVALLAGGFGSRAFSLTLAGAGLFYALFGMLRLGVWLDGGLLLTSLALAAVGWSLRRPSAPPATPLRPRYQ